MLTSSQRLYRILIYQQKKWLTHWGGGGGGGETRPGAEK